MSELAEIERLVRAYVDDVEEIFAVLADAEPDINEPHDTVRPPEFSPVEAGSLSPVSRTLADEDELDNSTHRDFPAMWSELAGR